MNFEALPPGGWWMVAGLLLLAAELLVPGVFLVFLGAAAVATGAFTLLFDLGLAPSLGLFALYSVVAVMVGKKVYGQPVTDEADGLLNERARQVVGRTVTVTRAIEGGDGRVKLGDSEWNARAEIDAQPGERLIVKGVEGTCLIVDRLDSLPPR